MTKDFLLLIRLFSFSAKGEPVSDELLGEFFDGDKGIDAEKLRRVYAAAMIQNCSAMTDIAVQDILVKLLIWPKHSLKWLDFITLMFHSLNRLEKLSIHIVQRKEIHCQWLQVS